MTPLTVRLILMSNPNVSSQIEYEFRCDTHAPPTAETGITVVDWLARVLDANVGRNKTRFTNELYLHILPVDETLRSGVDGRVYLAGVASLTANFLTRIVG